ncbi:Aminopeptidase N [Cyphomyrmex costatus]|uniref:Aminopeptidase N n=2 Tax=Cyphomyrmex costatus TaxID=456900 RepID=A0A195CEH8_9HYME|nr:Aminopeptidase N [Cyphomyrmex costatus]
MYTRKTKLVGRNGVTHKPMKYSYTPETNILDIEFFDLVIPGIYTLNIEMMDYISDKNINGLIRTSYMNEDEDTVWVIVPHIQETGTRQLFPCWDERHLKTTFTISVKHPENFIALSNMPKRKLKNDDIEHNFKWEYFYTTPAISTSQVSIILCNFLHVNINKNVNLWYRKSFPQINSLFYAQQVMKNISFHLEYEFGGIKIPKIDHIVIPRFSYNITTKLGFVFYSERELIYHEELGHIMNRIEIARSITRKTALQWFGDTLDLFVVQSQNEGLYFDSYFDRFPLFNTVSNIESIFNFPRYKVLIFLRMYRDLITDVVFRNGLRTYLHKLTFNSTSVSEFWSILQDLTKEYSCDFVSWLDFDHYPVVSWKQKHLLWSVLTYNSNSSNNRWWIPIRIMRNTTLSKVIKVWLTPQVQYKYFKGIPNNDAVMLDIQHAAYYRVNYKSKNWRRIGYYLKSGGYKNISVINCVKLIDDACHFLMTHQLNVSIFWKLTRYLPYETNFVAWYPIIKMLERISDMILYSQKDTNFMKFKEKMKQLLEISMKKIRYNEISTEDDFLKNLRRELARWACIFEVPSCMEAAKMKLEESIEYPKQHKKTLKPTDVQILTMADTEIFNDTYFNGTTHIMINILQAIKSIKLHIQTVNIKHSSIQLIDIHRTIHSPNKTIYDSTKNILHLDFIEVIYPGLYTLKICTTSRISNYDSEKNIFINTNYWSNDSQDMWSIAPNIQDIGAKTLFPCWDEPHLKTTFLVSVRHNPHFNVLSNMPIREAIREFHIKDVVTEYIQWTHNGHTQWTHFYPTPPISTYQFVIVINHMSKVKFKEKIEDKLNMTLWCKWKYCLFEKVVATRHKSLDLHMYIINKLTLHMKSVFKGIKFPKIDHIVLPNCPYNITSKWGVIFYSDTDIIYDHASDRFMRKIEFERRIAYKVAQQWFGYPVSSTWLNNVWLHDGLAIFFAEDAIAKIYNDSELMNLFIIQNQYDSLNLDSYYDLNFPIINTVPDFESLLNFPRYIKVIAVLRMLQNIVTDSVFRRGIHIYLNQHSSNFVNISDFWSIQENLAKESYPCDFKFWLFNKHYPIISCKHKNRNIVKLTQYCNLSKNTKWPLPINIEVKTSFPEKTKLYLTQQMHTHFFKVPVNKLIILNSQQTGQYRVYYDSENWLNIANYLNSGKYEDVNVIDRAKFIDDAFHMVIDHQLNGSVFWNLTKHLSQETDYVAWFPMIKALEYISTVFPLSKDEETNFTHVKVMGDSYY